MINRMNKCLLNLTTWGEKPFLSHCGQVWNQNFYYPTDSFIIFSHFINQSKVWEVNENENLQNQPIFPARNLSLLTFMIKLKAEKNLRWENDNIEFAPSNGFSFCSNGQSNVVSQDQSSVFAANSILLCQTL